MRADSVEPSSTQRRTMTETNGLLAKLQAADYAEILKQPLFTEGRRAIESEEKAVADPAQEKTTDDDAFKATLVGVSLSSESALALMQDKKGNYHRLTTGNRIQGWELKSIQPTSAIFTRNGTDKKLELEKLKTMANSTPSQPRLPPTDIRAATGNKYRSRAGRKNRGN